MQRWMAAGYRVQAPTRGRGSMILGAPPSSTLPQEGLKSAEGVLIFSLICGAALRTVTADFESGDDDVEAAISLNLPLQSIEKVTLKFSNLATAQTCHVDVVALRAALVEVFLALHMHQVRFVNQSVSLEQSQGAIHPDPVD